MDVWPDKAPGEKGDIGEEKAVKSTGRKPIIRISNVTKPTISVFKPPKEKDTGAAVLLPEPTPLASRSSLNGGG